MTILKKLLVGAAAFVGAITNGTPADAQPTTQYATAVQAHGRADPLSDAAIRASRYYRQNHLTLALTLWAEAQGEGADGMRMVGHVVLNRVASRQWGDSVNAVVNAPGQFSPWRADTADFHRLQRIRAAHTVGRTVPSTFVTALSVADQLLLDEARLRRFDETHGALYFHSTRLRRLPDWTRRAVQTVRHGGHKFWRPIATAS